MALCLADSILVNNFEINGVDLRFRFLAWWHLGYNNGLQGRNSFGLGGNISQSFNEFYYSQTAETTYIQGQNNGNGTLMRLSPIPIAFHDNLEKALDCAKKQSLTTHDGQEASGCSQLLTQLVIKLITRPENDIRTIKEIMNEFSLEFKHDIKSVEYLGQSKVETKEMLLQCKKDFNKSVADRNWNWKDLNFKYSLLRATQQPQYIGSYCMDALSMALHIAYYSTSFQDSVFKAANMGGDADTIGAIVGIITGAYYGLSEDLLTLYKFVNKWDNYAFPLKAFKLFKHIPVMNDRENETQYKQEQSQKKQEEQKEKTYEKEPQKVSTTEKLLIEKIPDLK